MYASLREAWQELTRAGAPFEIEEVEIRGVRMRAYASAPGSLRDVWLASAAHAEATYLVYQDDRWSYAEAHDHVASIAAWLAAQGVQPGDRVAIAMRNYPEWMLGYWATVSMGAVVVGMNAWWTSDEMAYALRDAAPKVVICDSERLERLQVIRDTIPAAIVVAVRVEGTLPAQTIAFDQLLQGGSLPAASIDPDADACLFYTSGTTGRPKGAQLTHRSCTNNITSMLFWAAAQARARQLAGTPTPAASRTRAHQPSALITTPLFHVTANNCSAHLMTRAGGKLVCMYRWDPGEALRLIEREQLTSFSGVPTMTRELLAHPDFDQYDTSSLALIGGGGAKFQADLVRKVDDRKGGSRPNTGYGLTETSGIITTNAADFLAARPDSVGPAMPCFETRCVDDDGNDVPAGQPGELWVKGAQVISGYWSRPEATAEAITDGWFHTGDVAVIDEDGFIEIVDRKKDMVLRGGENVYCSEVESVLFDHPDVAECAVFGVPDERLGEEIGAAIVLCAGSSPSTDALREHCARRIAKHKLPRYVWLLDEPLPRNASGKFLKRTLREQLDPADAN